MSTLDVAVDGKDEKTAAQLDDAPFPESGPIPTATVEIESGDEKPDVFGDAESAAPLGVEDAIIDEPAGNDKIPTTYAETAGDNELDQAVNDWHKANSTSAEELTKKNNEPAPKKTEAPAEEKPKRGRPAVAAKADAAEAKSE